MSIPELVGFALLVCLIPIFLWLRTKRSKREKKELPPFGSTTECRACGSAGLRRTYDDGWYAGEYVSGPFLWVRCDACGWHRGEQIKNAPADAT